MRKFMLIAALMVTGLSVGQSKSPQLEEVNGMVKATYFYENGSIEQEGLFKDGKLEGKWVSYDVDGKKKAIAEYKNGEKIGKWFYWNNALLMEVDYADNRVAAVKNWRSDSVADKN
jgi:antitoxin component YwqK of YwqJK toxin-antitoxin module